MRAASCNALVPERAVCEQHGLAYDPTQTEGCVLCRRQQAPPPSPAQSSARVLLFFGGIVLLLGGAAFGGKHWYEAQRAQVGKPCEARYGCVAGADCLARSTGPLPPIGVNRGVCYRHCELDTECKVEGERCRFVDVRRYCVRVADVGEACDANTLCDDSVCIVTAKGASAGTCRKRCIASCPDGLTCLRVASGLPLSMGELAFESVCLPPP